MAKKPSPPTTIRLPESVTRAVERMAKSKGLTMSAWIRMAIIERLEQEKV